MDKKYNGWKKLMRSGVFRDRAEVINYLLLKCLKETGGPVGCGALQISLEDYQLDCSTATVGRYLKMLDSKEYTIRYKNQGRILTPGGEAWLREAESSLERVKVQAELSGAMRVNEYDELSDLLWTRKILETEATRLAAIHATPEDLERLEQAVKAHQQCIEENRDPTDSALTFHKTVAEISHNKFMEAMLNMLTFEEKRIESLMETLVTRERGSIYIKEHVAIAEAIRSHDSRLAAHLMDIHIKELYDAIEEQAQDFDERRLSFSIGT